MPQFERASGHKLNVDYQASPVLVRQIEAGGPFDVVITVSGPMNEAAKKGFFADGARPAVSSVGLGAAVKPARRNPT